MGQLKLKQIAGAAASGANADITSLSGLTTPLSQAQGGLGNTTGDASGLSVTANASGLAGTLARLMALPQPARMRVGGAAPDTGSDWLATAIPFTTTIAQAPVLSNSGKYALLGGSRTSDLATAGNQGTIALGGFVLNDNATNLNTAYAEYLEARRAAGAGTTHCVEANIINQGTTISLDPYSSLAQSGLTLGHWLSSGRSDLTGNTDASAGFGIINNGAAFKRGIVITQNAITGATGTGGTTGEAISLAQGHQIAWYAANGTPGAYVWSAVTGTGLLGQRLVFTDTGPQFQNTNGSALFSVGASATAVNGITVTPGSTGNPPVLAASGSDSAVALAIRSKAAGSPIYLQGGSGNTAIQINPVASGVNYGVFTGAAAGASPKIAAQGTDTNVALTLLGQGTSGVLAGVFSRTADPTASDIPSGQAAVWSNTSAGTFKLVANISGTLRSIALS